MKEREERRENQIGWREETESETRKDKANEIGVKGKDIELGNGRILTGCHVAHAAQ